MNNKNENDINIGDIFGILKVIDIVRIKNPNIPTRHDTKIKLKCSNCGSIYYANPYDVKIGKYKGCKNCEKDIIPIGTRFGKLVTISDGERIKSDSGKLNHFYKCKCDCGDETRVNKYNLLSGNIKSCGCGKLADSRSEFKYRVLKRLGKEKRDFDIEEKVGTLTIKEKLMGYKYRCDCDCGGINVIVSRQTLDTALRPSCGCTNKNGTIAFKKLHPEITPFIDRAKAILDRCRSPKDSAFHNYGGRGIKCLLGNTQTEVAYSLSMIPGFKEGYDIDRIHPNGDYTFNNLRWASREENMNNIDRLERVDDRLRTRSSANNLISRRGEALDSYDFIEATKINIIRMENPKNTDTLYLVVPKEYSQEDRDKIMSKFESLCDKWLKYKEAGGYNYFLSKYTTKESFLYNIIERCNI